MIVDEVYCVLLDCLVSVLYYMYTTVLCFSMLI